MIQKEYKIYEIHTMPKDKMMKYFNMSSEEQLIELQKHIDMGKVCEDTVVFPPGQEIRTDFYEDRQKKMLGPDLSYRGMGWQKINPEMRNNLINNKTRAEQVIDSWKTKKHENFMFSFKKLYKNIIKYYQ